MGKPRPNRMNPRLKRIMPRPFVMPPSAGASDTRHCKQRGNDGNERVLNIEVQNTGLSRLC